MTEVVLATEPGATVLKASDEVVEEPAHRKAACYVWALLLARICEVLPLVSPEWLPPPYQSAFIRSFP